jgi:broad specificity phosphatase PhoE
MKIFLLRHGNTFNAGEVAYQIGSRTDLPLTEKGIQQAKQFANHLQQRGISPTAIYSGTLQRQTQTAHTIHTFFPHVPLFINEVAFNEIDYGAWEGLTSDAIESKWPKEYRAWQEEGIWPSPIFLTRWEDHIALLKKWGQKIQENALIISSNGILRLMLHFVLNNDKTADKVSTGHYCELVFDQHFQATIESWNRKPD